MPRVVVILGAGASADFRVPILRYIFKDHYAKLFLRARPAFAKQLQTLFWEPRGHTVESSENSVTVEEMLTILRDWETEEACPMALDPAIARLVRRDLYGLIQRAVYEGKSTRPEHLNGLIHYLSERCDQVTWASFNWDCIFEASYWYARHGNPKLVIELNGWQATSTKHEFLKLHGGINWWTNKGSDLEYVPFGTNGNLTARWKAYIEGKDVGEPVILEPSVYKYKDEKYTLLKPQWDRFLERLCMADLVLILGYSFPEADSLARSKITVGFQVNAGCHWLLVDPGADTCERYRRILGKNRLTVRDVGLSHFNSKLDEHLKFFFPTIAQELAKPLPQASSEPFNASAENLT